MKSNTLCLLGMLVAGLSAGCGDDYDDGLTKHQVTGQVLVNGTPEKGIAVCFQNSDPDVTGNAARPVAVTDAEGKFALSTNGPQDGAISGKYHVTFHWPQGGSSMKDFFDGKYVTTSGPEFDVTIGENDTGIPPFQLEAPQSAVDAARKALSTPMPLN